MAAGREVANSGYGNTVLIVTPTASEDTLYKSVTCALIAHTGAHRQAQSHSVSEAEGESRTM